MKNRRRIALLIVVLFLLGTGTIAAYQSLSKTIAIIDDGKVTQYETNDIYVGEVLETAQIELGEKDKVEPDLTTKVENGMKINIYRWKPTVILTHNGVTHTFRTTAETVGEVLESKDIALTGKSEINIDVEDKITDGIKIDVKTEEILTEVREVSIPYEQEVQTSKELAPGEEKVLTPGENGTKSQTVEVIRYGGQTVSETVVSEKVTKKPTTQVVVKGIKNSIIDEYTGTIYEYTDALTLEATAYTDIPGDRWYDITATGAHTFRGMVAVDPSVIPLNTILYVEGYGIAIAGDTGGAIKGHDIDLFMESPDEVYNFGRRPKKVYILKEQNYDVADIIDVRKGY